jgi:hypothetical protein
MKIEVSIGEIVDKFTILEIKEENCFDSDKLKNIQKELTYLKTIVSDLDVPNELVDSLRLVNRELWNIEDDIRVCESKWKFDDDFIQLARSVYYTNDKRFQIKNEINSLMGSNFKEEKILPKYI